MTRRLFALLAAFVFLFSFSFALCDDPDDDLGDFDDFGDFDDEFADIEMGDDFWDEFEETPSPSPEPSPTPEPELHDQSEAEFKQQQQNLDALSGYKDRGSVAAGDYTIFVSEDGQHCMTEFYTGKNM